MFFAPAPPPSTLPLPPKGLRVLVGEDDANVARSLARQGPPEGHATLWTWDGPTLLRVVRDWAPDVVLLDLTAPGLNGDGVARRVRDMNLWKRPLLIAVTGFGRDLDRARCEAAGFDLCLVKPVDPEQLFRLLRRFRAVLYA